ncbi:MAG: extracellular solute-binding protein, partial [bacterium]|nr:extracellular solute-binding protein [bacterium]
GGSRTELIEKLAADYQKMNPDVEFEITFTPPNDLQKKVVQAAGTGTLPDVVQMHSGWYVNLSPADTLLNLDEYVKKDGIVLEDILVDAEAKRSYYEGSVYSLPNVIAGGHGLFFYNKGLMEKAGLDPVKDAPGNWAEFTQVSKTLVEKLNAGDRLDVIAWDPNQMAGQPAVLVFSYGAGFPTVTEDGKQSLLNAPEVVETARKFDTYIEEVYGKFGGYKAIIEWNSRVAGADTGAAQVQAFIKEAQTFYVSGSWTIGQVKSGNADMDFGILPVPGFSGQHGATAKHGWSYAINKNAEDADAAWDFLKFITIDAAGNGEFCKAQNRPSPIAAVNEDPHYQAMGDMWNNLVLSMNKDIVPPGDIYMDTVKPWLRDIPARRMAGESIEDIMADIHAMFQDYLDDLYE